MTRTQKKCFLFSVGLHGLLAVVVIGTSGFREKPPSHDIPIMTMIPSEILDVSGSGGGGGSTPPAAKPQQQPAPTVPQPKSQPAPQPQPQPRPRPQPQMAVARIPEPEPVERPRHHEVEEETARPSLTPKTSKVRPPRHHDVQVDLTPVTADDHRKLTAQHEAAAAEAAARTEARWRKRLAESLDNLANGVESSGAKETVVNLPGQGGGAAFAGYETVIFNAYYHAWITPDNIADKLAAAKVEIVVARDGSIISAEVTNPSGDAALDRSVEKALRAVTKLPPFPAGATDEQRHFLIRFNLDTKEQSG
jgi:TonB family protein